MVVRPKDKVGGRGTEGERGRGGGGEGWHISSTAALKLASRTSCDAALSPSPNVKTANPRTGMYLDEQCPRGAVAPTNQISATQLVRPNQ